MAARFLKWKNHKFIRYTAGNITMNQTAWTDFVTGGVLDMTLSRVVVGDVLKFTISAVVGNAAIDSFFDVVTLNPTGATPLNSFAGAGPVTAPGSPHYGPGGWYTTTNRQDTLTGDVFYIVVAGDISSAGRVTVRPRYASTATSARTLYASTANPMFIAVENKGPQAA